MLAVVEALAAPVIVIVAPPMPEMVPEIVDSDGAVMFSVKLCEDAPEVAVIFAVWLVEIELTVAVKTALEAPAATDTVAGTLAAALLLASVTVRPDVVTPLNVTVQVEVPGAVTVAGLQDSPLTVGATLTIVIAPLLADPGTDSPAGDDTLTPVTWIDAEGSGAPGAITNVAFARLPPPMTVLFIP
jgi:hypothetical protein